MFLNCASLSGSRRLSMSVLVTPPQLSPKDCVTNIISFFCHLLALCVLVNLFSILFFHQVPLKFRYPFLAQIMWYAADKYLRLLEKDKNEQGLPFTTKKGEKKQIVSEAKTKDTTVNGKGRSSDKRVSKTDGEDKRDASLPAVKESTEDDAKETPGRRRSSRVAKNEAIAKQGLENDEREKTLKKEESEGGSGRRKATKKNKDDEDSTDVNGEYHDGENQKEKDSVEDNEAEEDKEPWRPVYLTRFEVEGLNKLIERLRNWPQAKKNVPAKLDDPYGLLDRLEVCVSGHSVKDFTSRI